MIYQGYDIMTMYQNMERTKATYSVEINGTGVVLFVAETESKAMDWIDKFIEATRARE
jgi:hypothetical protein